MCDNHCIAFWLQERRHGLHVHVCAAEQKFIIFSTDGLDLFLIIN
jgi:hypothetical protein